MIYTSFSDPFLWHHLPSKVWREGVDWIKTNSVKIADGTYPIRGEQLFAKVMTYSTKPRRECFFEAHQGYVDLQTCISGIEVIDWFGRADGKLRVPYSEATDLAVYHEPATYSSLSLSGDAIAIFFPNDVHRPQVSAVNQADLRKIVLKVAVSLTANARSN